MATAYDATLEVLKNSLVNPHHLNFVAKLSSNVTFSPKAGRVVRLNASGEFEMGLPNTVGAAHMPIFLWSGAADTDVSNPSSTSGPGEWAAALPDGYLVGLVAVGAWELETTEYDSAQSYNPGDALTATPNNTDSATGGRLTKATAYGAPICGVVSRGVHKNARGKNVLSFWPVWLPRQA